MIEPMKKKRLKPHTAKNAVEKTAIQVNAEKEPLKRPMINASKPLAEDVHRSLERKREKSLRQGNVEIEAKLDLHGLTQTEAFEALADFMHGKVKAGKRHLLIITGKGRRGAGVLRNNLENWLAQLPEAKLILALRPAASKHGGEGAFYVVLRKK
jgi:DNA-nicking Smr family endonuclease